MANLTRQELYDKIKESSKDEYILAEMIRLGFWEEERGEPTLSEQLIKEHGALTRELNKLLAKQRRYRNREALLKELAKQRMEESKRKQKENKERREKERIAKAEAWKKKQAEEIVFLGKGVSAGLSKTESDTKRLTDFNLPVFENALALATAIGISLNELRFLSFSRKTSTVSHYKRFYLAKKTGGKRLISAPMPRLKAVQHWILEHILYKVPLHDAAHGFALDRSIKTNARPHLQADIVVNIDVKNFFPTISYRRTKGMFKKLGYSEQIATILGLICTEPEVDEVVMDGKTYFIDKSERFLPQGAPTSPAITNIICYRLDKRLEGMAKKVNYIYTRYADDMTFSAKGQKIKDVNRVLWQAKQIVEDEGFTVHPDKIHIMRTGSRKEVTGVIVNDKLGIQRKKLRNFRATLYQIEQTGIEGKTWGNGHILNTIQGYASYVYMIDPAKGAPLLARVNAILEQHHNERPVSKRLGKVDPSNNTSKSQGGDNQNKGDEDSPWWKVW